MSVKNADLVDLIATTLPDLPNQYFEVTWDNTDYEFSRIYQSERMEIDGGTQIERVVQFDESGNARYRKMFDTDEPNIADTLHTIKVPWTQIGTHYSWDVLEIKRNMNSAKGFIRLMETRRIDGLWSLANLIEDRAWKTPTNSTDDLYPYGVPYYLNCLDADATTAGFNAKTIRYQDGTTGTACANIDANVEAKWKNYGATYTSIDNSLLKTMRKAFLLTNFKAPLFVKDPADERVASKRIYTDSDNVSDLMELADAKDDNHSGRDVLGNLTMDDGGLVFINRIPVVFISELEGVTDPVTSTPYKPIYYIDFRKFVPYVQDGYWMEEGEPQTDRGQHTTFTVFLDGAHNNMCLNRRTAGFVVHKPIVS